MTHNIDLFDNFHEKAPIFPEKAGKLNQQIKNRMRERDS
jgi:hypothetical protein